MGGQDCSGLAAASLLGLPLGKAASPFTPSAAPSHPQRKCPIHTFQTGGLQQVLTWPFRDY